MEGPVGLATQEIDPVRVVGLDGQVPGCPRIRKIHIEMRTRRKALNPGDEGFAAMLGRCVPVENETVGIPNECDDDILAVCRLEFRPPLHVFAALVRQG
jgi:hypothetical protein